MSEPTLPTEEDIAKLPRWARVAFAARCARRVLPQLQRHWPEMPTQHAKAVALATRVAEDAACEARGTFPGNIAFVADAAFAAADATAVRGAAFTARAAAYAASATAYAAEASHSAHRAAAARTAQRAAVAAQALSGADPVRADFDHLAALAQAKSWTDDTPVPPEVFGPLWPDGPPPGWPDETNHTADHVPAPGATPDPDHDDLNAPTQPTPPGAQERRLANAGLLLGAGASVPHANKWELVRRLGAGGFGEVWLARHRGTGAERAVKFCLRTVALEYLHRGFRHESNVADYVQAHTGGHPHIVPMLECNLSGETPWLMYEYVPGGRSLADVIEELKLLPSGADRAARAVPLLHTIATAVGQLHRLERKIVHRDLTPRNVLLAAGDVPRITDFGIGGAAVEATLVAATGNPDLTVRVPTLLKSAGTPPHASPEQKRGAEPHPQDDVFALGVMLYQLLTGEARDGPGANAAQKLTRLKVPTALVELVVASVSDPEDRPADGAAFADALALLLPGASTAPAPLTRRVDVPGLWYSRPAGDPNAEWERLGYSPCEITFAPDRVYQLTVSEHVAAEDFVGLQSLTALTELDLSFCANVTNLEPLAGLTALTTLNLSGCANVASLKPLAGLTMLATLNLHRCTKVTSLEPLAGLTALTALNLNFCTNVTNLEPLAGLTSLTALNLYHCEKVTSLEPLTKLTALTTLNLTGCMRVTDLAPLISLPNLKKLSLTAHPGLTVPDELRRRVTINSTS